MKRVVLLGVFCVFLFFGVLINVYSQTKVQRQSKQDSSQTSTNTVNVVTNNIEEGTTGKLGSNYEFSSSKDFPIEVEIKTFTTPESSEGVEYIKTYTKEKGLKIYVELGGGPLVVGGVVWRITPMFGLGIGGGYTPLPYRNFGPVLDLRVEFVPVYFFIVGDELKINVVSGFRGVFFFGSMTQYVGASLGIESLVRSFQYIVPSFNIYLYLAGREIIPQLSFQIRFQF